MKNKLTICLATAAVCLIAGAAFAGPRNAPRRAPRTAPRAAARVASVLEIDPNRQAPAEDTNLPSLRAENMDSIMGLWYVRNYATVDPNADSRPSVATTEAEYIERLKNINTVIHMPYNNEVRSFINMYADKRKSLVSTLLGKNHYYLPIFENALEKYGVPQELKYLPIIESALNPTAVSPAGAGGLWQFMPSTATGLGLEVSSLVDERRDPYRSSEAAARLLKQLFETYNDWSLAIAAYNCGPGNVNKALRRAGNPSADFWEIYRYLPSETRGYVPAFIAANYIMTYYDKHNIKPVVMKKPLLVDTVKINKRIHFQQISDVLGIPMDEIRGLNPQYRTDIIPGSKDRPYTLALPYKLIDWYVFNEDSIANHDADRYSRRLVVEPGSSKNSRNKITTMEQVTPPAPEETAAAEPQPSEGTFVEDVVVKYHKVGRNETLASIATRYGVSEKDIAEANDLDGNVTKGQTLKINTVRRRFVAAAPAAETTTVASTATSNSYVPEPPARHETPKASSTPVPPAPARTQADRAHKAQPEVPQPKSNTYKPNVLQPAPQAKPATKTQPAAKEAPVQASASKKTTTRDDSREIASGSSSRHSSRDAQCSNARESKKDSKKDSKRESWRESRKDSKRDAQKDDKGRNKRDSKKDSKKESKRERQTAKTTQHSVKEGDNLYNIAKKNGVSVEDIKKANHMKDNMIKPGNKLIIPKAQKANDSKKGSKSSKKGRR
ncbi:MAG: transglycosylase SLT domain-containing protein [Muribaculaceae bacterium]|nr:transglycosylase SLT domain-containing protein [Muribaculaceae bacterium]